MVLAIDVNMGIACGPDMRASALLHGIPLLLQLLHYGGHIHDIPHDDGVRAQIGSQAATVRKPTAASYPLYYRYL